MAPSAKRSQHLGRLLRDIRVKAGDGIKKVAPALEVDYSYLSKVENGVANPSADFLSRVAAHYGVPVDVLFLAAGKLPPDVADLIEERPEEVISVLRKEFALDTKRS